MEVTGFVSGSSWSVRSAHRPGGRRVARAPPLKRDVVTSVATSDLKEVPEKKSLPKPIGPFFETIGLVKNTRRWLEDGFADCGGDIFEVDFGAGGRGYVVRGEEAAVQVLGNRENKVRPVAVPTIEKLLGETSLPHIDGNEYNLIRGLLMPSFAPISVSRQIEKIEARWQAMFDDLPVDSEPFEAVPRIRTTMFAVMMECFFDISESSQVAQFEELFQSFLGGIISLGWELPGTTFSKALKSRDRLRDLIQDVIVAKRGVLSELQEGDERPADTISLFLEARGEEGEALSDKTIIDNSLLLMFAGFDTTTSTICRLLQMLITPGQEEVLERLREEFREQPSGPMTARELLSLEYAKRVRLETVRLWPAAPNVVRELVEDTELLGYRVKAGHRVLIAISATNMHPSVYEDPEKFNPDRFGEGEPAPAELPTFGNGKRFCVGKSFADLNIAVFIRNIAKYADSHNLVMKPDQNLEKPDFLFTEVPRSGLLMSVKSR